MFMSNYKATNYSGFGNIELYYSARVNYLVGMSSPAYYSKSYLLYHALSGSCVFQINGIDYPFNAGEIMWRPPGTMISMLPLKDNPMQIRNFRFTINDPLLLQRMNNIFPTIKTDASLNNMLDYMFENWRDRSDDNQAIISAFSYSILNLFLLDQNRVKNNESAFVFTDGYSPATKRTITFLETHRVFDITMEDIGQQMGYNPNYLSSNFSKETGFTIKNYIHFLRIRNAVINFFYWMLSVSAVSNRLHFNSISHFSRIFKHYIGIPPSDFYKACCSLSTEERTLLLNTEPILSYHAMPINELFDALHHIGNTMKSILNEKNSSTSN